MTKFPRLAAATAKLLHEGGVAQPAELHRLTDDDILAIDGIGPGRLADIRKHYPYEPDPFAAQAEGPPPEAPEVAGRPVVGDFVVYTNRMGQRFDAKVFHAFAGRDDDLLDLRAYAPGGAEVRVENVPFDPSGAPGTWRHLGG